MSAHVPMNNRPHARKWFVEGRWIALNSRCKNVFLSVARGPNYRWWAQLHPHTKDALFGRGLVVISLHKGGPVLTNKGLLLLRAITHPGVETSEGNAF